MIGYCADCCFYDIYCQLFIVAIFYSFIIVTADTSKSSRFRVA